jgi:hypothetical protein
MRVVRVKANDWQFVSQSGRVISKHTKFYEAQREYNKWFRKYQKEFIPYRTVAEWIMTDGQEELR